jgi:hypothetical protein
LRLALLWPVLVLVLFLVLLVLTWGGGGFLRMLNGTGGTRLGTARAAPRRCPWATAGKG